MQAGGAQIQPGNFGAFTARISAYDAANMLIGSFTANGNSAFTSHNSAIFIGLGSDTANISSLVFSLDSAALGGVGNFSINQVSLNDAVVSVPEGPATLSLFGLGAAAVELLRRKLRS